MDLSEIPTEELVHEVQRRLECLSKPEKRLILIGAPPRAAEQKQSSRVPLCAAAACRCCMLPLLLWGGLRLAAGPIAG